MARTSNGIDNMSYRELAEMQTRIERLKIEKQNAERDELRRRIVAMVKEAGFEMSDLFGKGLKTKGNVSVKYRDPQNPENTWTGRGRMPRWMAAATKGGKVKKDDFLV
jgi:DNA-binding protein H-NS